MEDKEASGSIDRACSGGGHRVLPVGRRGYHGMSAHLDGSPHEPGGRIPGQFDPERIKSLDMDRLVIVRDPDHDRIVGFFHLFFWGF